VLIVKRSDNQIYFTNQNCLTMRLFLFTVILLCFGCATNSERLTSPNGESLSKDRFKQYVESVFKRQNQAMSSMIMMPVDELSTDLQAQLLDAEHSVNTRCKALNDVANLHIDGKKESMFQKLKISRSVNDCDAATLQLEAVLERASEELQQEQI
jgi:hypothetical protein